ncbi:MAG: TonB-dependent receptor [Bacteroidetes bacterium]|nr:TonB-dependent receptor [Bacteroidota bacterium]
MKFVQSLVFILLCSSLFAQQNMGTISGKVVDKFTQEAIPGANIIVIDNDRGAATDAEGNFTIDKLPAKNYQIRISSVGYESVIKTDIYVSTGRPVQLFIELNEAVIELDGVTVSADYFEMNPTEMNSLASFSYEELRRAPGGLEDVVRALSILPGVARVSAGRNDLVVRGGAPTENLFLVDGFVIPNINHFGTQGATGGPLSYINLDYVNNTTFSTGGFSALYGDKLSSVLAIDLREGRSDRIGGKATISASQFGLNLEGPLSGKGNFLFSARRSYLDFIFNAAGFNFVPEYWDVLGKAVYEIDNQNKLSFLFVSAFDNVKFNNNNEEDLYDNSRILANDQIQYLLGLSYRHLFENGFYKVSLSRNFVDYDASQRDTLLNPVFLNLSSEIENELKADIVLKLSSSSELNVGAAAKLIEFDANLKFPFFKTSFGETLSINSLVASETYQKYGGYLQFSDVIFQRLRYSLGARADYFSGIEKKFYLSPRLSASYMLSEITSLNMSGGIYYQFPSYLWLSTFDSNKKLEAVNVNQIVVGIEHYLRDDIRVKLEGYYKDYRNYPTSQLRNYLVLANTGVGFAGADDNYSAFGLEPLTNDGTGNVKGFELSLQKKAAKVPHYALFSLTYSEAKFTAIDGIERAGAYDQTWILNLTGGYIFNQKWETSLKFRLATGNPYTPYNNDGSQSVSNYNSTRFDPLHSLDIRVDRKWNFEDWNLIAYIDIQNIYNNKNSNSIKYNYRENKIESGSSLGIFPTIGISAEF